MKMWLTRQNNGLYMLTRHKPVMHTVEGRDFQDAYVVPGEPIGIRNFCDLILQLVGVSSPLKRGESIEIELQGRVV